MALSLAVPPRARHKRHAVFAQPIEFCRPLAPPRERQRERREKWAARRPPLAAGTRRKRRAARQRPSGVGPAGARDARGTEHDRSGACRRPRRGRQCAGALPGSAKSGCRKFGFTTGGVAGVPLKGCGRDDRLGSGGRPSPIHTTRAEMRDVAAPARQNSALPVAFLDKGESGQACRNGIRRTDWSAGKSA